MGICQNCHNGCRGGPKLGHCLFVRRIRVAYLWGRPQGLPPFRRPAPTRLLSPCEAWQWTNSWTPNTCGHQTQLVPVTRMSQTPNQRTWTSLLRDERRGSGRGPPGANTNGVSCWGLTKWLKGSAGLGIQLSVLPSSSGSLWQ
jgi:hypothetical protein